MVFLDRFMDLSKLLENKSYFLLGPRQTGKSSIIKHTLSEYKTYDLLDNEVYLNLNQNPKRIEQELKLNDTIVTTPRSPST